MTAQHRILCNSQNLIRAALLAASSVKPAANSVIPDRTTSRRGTGRVQLTGSYTGDEDATLDIEILDTAADVTRASTPVLIGTGSGTLTSIAAEAPFAAQDVVVTLKDRGIPIVSAALDFEGVKLISTTPGDYGNNTHINVDSSELVFTATESTLLFGLAAGQGGPTSPLIGSEHDFGHAAVGDDGVIPDAAPRIAFGDDEATVYTAYKRFDGGQWGYYYVPALVRAYPAGTRVKTVTGTRTVTITDSNDSPETVETYPSVITVYDLLSQIRENSALVTVQGVVALDRTPAGQAARELLVRTDAHAQPSYGTGSRYATGFESAFAAATAGTKAITARCYAITGRDHPQAHLGAERWQVVDTLLGTLADAVTGVAYVGSDFGFLIPRRLPPGYGSPKGRYSVTAINYATRDEGETRPPICVDLAPLGSDAIDQTITLTYRARPSGDCACDSLPTPRWSGRCLGTVTGEGSTVGYQSDTVDRLVDMRAWYRTQMRAYSSVVDPGSTGARMGSQYSVFTAPVGVRETVVTGTATSVSDQSGLSLKEICDRFEEAIALIDPLEDGSPSLRNSGLAIWDAALAELKADFAEYVGEGVLLSMPSDQYLARLDEALTSAGLSPLGESDASILESGDGCWRDWGDAYWWEIAGSEGGGYAPAFNNKPYYSSRRASQRDKYFSTHEYGLVIKIKDGCDVDLKDGDQITLAIGDATWPSTYQVGDLLTLPIVAVRDAYLAGGQDGNTLQVWNVNASVAGAMPTYTLDASAPTPYSSGGLSFLITPGGIDFALNDRFAFSIEGGHFRWRVNAGAWNTDSPPADIPSGAALLYEGLSATFIPGAAPSFAAGDVFNFTLKQPRAPSNLQRPGPEVWRWDGDDQSIVCDLGSAQTISMLAIALHTIPAGATITVDAGTTVGVYPDSTTLTRVEGPIVKELDAPWTARYVRVTINDAPDASIGWLYAGEALATSKSAEISLSRSYRIARGSGGLYQGGRYLGKAVSGEMEWNESLSDADLTALQAVLDYLKAADNEPIVVVPNITRPEEALLAHVAVDEVEFPDLQMYGADAGRVRRLSTRIPMSGVWR